MFISDLKKTLTSLCLPICFLWASTAVADPGAREQLQQQLNSMKTMQASFSQTVKSKRRLVSQSKGTMALFRPGKFRWVTDAPMKQLVVADGKKIWVYDVELEQVSVQPQAKSLGGTAGLFLSGYNQQAAKDFDVSLQHQDDANRYELKALSRDENIQRVILMFSKDRLMGLELFDQLGQHTVVTLTKIRVNQSLPESLFKFSPPKGVDVVHT